MVLAINTKGIQENQGRLTARTSESIGSCYRKTYKTPAVIYSIFLPRVRGTIIGSCWEQYLPLLYIDNLVTQFGSLQVRFAVKRRDGRSEPDSGLAPTACSDIRVQPCRRGT
jgi:hypothetical protein